MEELNKVIKDIVIVDANLLYRVILKKMLSSSTSLIISNDFGNADDAIKYLTSNPVDVVLINNLPYQKVIESSKILKSISPKIKIILFSSNTQEYEMFAYLSAIVDAYLYGEITQERLNFIINWVYLGYLWVDFDFQFNVFSLIKFLPKEDYDYFRNSLNVTEYEVVLLVLKGFKNNDISTLLNISIHELFSIVYSIFEKLSKTSKSKNLIKDILYENF